jgi:hypothetical protein
VPNDPTQVKGTYNRAGQSKKPGKNFHPAASFPQ